MRLADTPITAMRLGRLTNALVSLGLIALAAFVLWDHARGALSLAGLLVAVTPAVIFFSTNLNPTGPEIASAVCFAASLLRLTRATHPPRWVWMALAASGVVLALSRSLGPVFVVVIMLAVAALTGPGRTRAAVASAPAAATAAAVSIAVACGAGLIWELRYQPHVPLGPRAIFDGLGPSFADLPRMPKEAVGVFGALDTFLPLTAYIVWWIMFAALLAGALYASRAFERASLLGLAVAVVVAALVLAAVYRQTGFDLQGRYLMPFAVILPLWAGELLYRNRDLLGGRAASTLLGGLVAGGALVQGVAWWTNARGVSGDGDWLFASDAGWVPPLGWWTWMVVVLSAAGAYVVAGLMASRAAAQPHP